MSNSIVNVGDLSKPATVLIEKISDAVGGYFRPYQIKRVAKAEAEADKIKALAKIEIDEIQERALRRFVAEEARNQINIETIGSDALPLLEENATPENVEDDWITNFFDKCRLVSDNEMQHLWSRVLAGEANSPGKFSKRTVNALSSIDIQDAQFFTNLCRFCWISREQLPLIYDVEDKIYRDNGVTYFHLEHLAAIGLIRLDAFAGFKIGHMPRVVKLSYFGTSVLVDLGKDDSMFPLGIAVLTKIGQEFASVCNPKTVPDFLEYVREKWTNEGINSTIIQQER